MPVHPRAVNGMRCFVTRLTVVVAEIGSLTGERVEYLKQGLNIFAITGDRNVDELDRFILVVGYISNTL